MNSYDSLMPCSMNLLKPITRKIVPIMKNMNAYKIRYKSL